MILGGSCKLGANLAQVFPLLVSPTSLHKFRYWGLAATLCMLISSGILPKYLHVLSVGSWLCSPILSAQLYRCFLKQLKTVLHTDQYMFAKTQLHKHVLV